MGRVLSMHLHSRRDGVSTSTKGVDSLDGAIVGAVLEALVQIGMTEEQAIARLLGVDRSQWSKQKAGRDGHHMSVQRLEKLPPEFLRALAMSLNRRAGLRVADPDLRRQALSKAIRAIGDAVEALENDPQLPLFSERVG